MQSRPLPKQGPYFMVPTMAGTHPLSWSIAPPLEHTYISSLPFSRNYHPHCSTTIFHFPQLPQLSLHPVLFFDYSTGKIPSS
jgi:hypothetical protein